MKFSVPSIDHSKPHSFHKIQMKWFGGLFTGTEKISLTVAQLQEIHDEAHEHGRMRERAVHLNGISPLSVKNKKFY